MPPVTAASADAPGSAGHHCDCQSPSGAEPAGGVRLFTDREHVRRRVVELRGRTGGGLTLIGAGWVDALADVLGSLTFPERSCLYAEPVGAPGALPVRAEIALLRARTPWLPAILSNRALVPHFQPVVRLSDGAVIGQEALMRAEACCRLLSGAEIVAAATAHDRLMAFDVRARSVALEQGFPLLPAGQSLFVNFTPTAIYDPDVCLRTTWAAARRAGADLGRVCFEVMETEAFPDLELLRAILDRFRERGARVALDDLGAGNSSLLYLDVLRPDVVKLDRGLIAGLDQDAARRRMVGALADYAHELDAEVVAEGVETAGELHAVRELGADLAQGYYLARPAARPHGVDAALVTGLRAA
jgi:EAL domain-containing protein (putative c-di-GMP-specific phosphodiesterase class I)